MPINSEHLNRALGLSPGPHTTWVQVMSELWPIISTPLSAEGERLLLRIVHFDGRLRLEASSDFPHSMTPEEMLKSLSIQSLTKWTGLTYLSPIQKIELLTTSASLQSMARAVVQQARATLPASSRADAISETETIEVPDQDSGWTTEWTAGHPTSKVKLVQVEHLVGHFGPWTFLSQKRPQRPKTRGSHEKVGAAWTEML